MGYLYFPNDGSSGLFNPAYAAAGVFEVRQPFLRGFGSTVNTAPIRIAQSRADQSRWQVEEVTIRQIRSVAESYWQLYAAHVAYNATRNMATLAEESVRLEELRYQAERSIYSDLARTKVQLERLRQQAAGTRLRLAERDNQLRQLVGLEMDGSLPLVPTDPPRQDLLAVDMSAAVKEALDKRPDLQQKRVEIQRLDLQRQVAQNQTLPQLDARYLYRSNGLANHFDGAVRQASTLAYTDWTFGFEFSVPLGNQGAKSRLSARELEVARERARLREFERQVAYDLSVMAAELQSRWEQAESARREVTESERWLQLAIIRYKNPRISGSTHNVQLTALDDFQRAMQASVSSQTAAAEALASYNISLARIEEAKGTLLESWRIEFGTDENGQPTAGNGSVPPSPTSNYRTVSHSRTGSETGHSLVRQNATGRLPEAGHSITRRRSPARAPDQADSHEWQSYLNRQSASPTATYHQNSVLR